MIKVDTSGTSCPQPVLMTKKALTESTDAIEVIVDNNTSKTNVTKFLTSQGFSVSIVEGNENYTIKAEK
jgi:tRNA 2-thiouridine synthesizing protein A